MSVGQFMTFNLCLGCQTGLRDTDNEPVVVVDVVVVTDVGSTQPS